MLLPFLFLFCSLFSVFNCAKIGKNLSSLSPPSAPHPPSSSSKVSDPKFENFDLLKRPLNAYVVENGKHAKAEEKSIQIGGTNHSENVANTVKYNIWRPPFAIIQRGAVIVLNCDDNGTHWPNWHYGHPSIVQMLAASGHVVVEFKADEAEQTIWKIVALETMHKLVIVEMCPKSIGNTINKLIEINDQLDAIVLLNGDEKFMTELRKNKNEFGKDKRPILIVLNGEKEVKAMEGEDKRQKEDRGQKVVAQMMVNLLDKVHPRR